MEQQILERLTRIEDTLTRLELGKKEWLTVQEFARATGLHPKSVSEMCLSGKLNAMRSDHRRGPNQTWRIRQAEVERYQRDGAVPSKHGNNKK